MLDLVTSVSGLEDLPEEIKCLCIQSELCGPFSKWAIS